MSDYPQTSDLQEMDESRLTEIAQRKSQEILRNIDALLRDIETAQESAQSAEQLESGWWGGKTSAKADATAKSLVLTNKAIAQMNALIRESIQFSCGSYRLSALMLQQLAVLSVEGFEDTNGKIVRINKNCTEFVNILIAEIDKFNGAQSALDAQARQIQEVQKRSDEGDRELSQRISETAQIVLERSDQKDAIHDAQIRKLEADTASIYSISEQKDEMHDREIRRLSSDLDALISRLDNLESLQELIKKQNSRRAALALSIIAMVLSVAAALMNILR